MVGRQAVDAARFFRMSLFFDNTERRRSLVRSGQGFAGNDDRFPLRILSGSVFPGYNPESYKTFRRDLPCVSCLCSVGFSV
jgi:hypothetical protein